jgi:hypothetical protein
MLIDFVPTVAMDDGWRNLKFIASEKKKKAHCVDYQPLLLAINYSNIYLYICISKS